MACNQRVNKRAQHAEGHYHTCYYPPACCIDTGGGCRRRRREGPWPTKWCKGKRRLAAARGSHKGAQMRLELQAHVQRNGTSDRGGMPLKQVENVDCRADALSIVVRQAAPGAQKSL